jgi:hypothetical protein
MSHEGFRFDDYHIWGSFWRSLNGGWLDMNYQWEFEKFWGKGVKPERIFLKEGDFNAFIEQLNLPSDATLEVVNRLMNRKTPWEKQNENKH